MDNNVTATTQCTTIERRSMTKGFSPRSPSPPPEDLINNNPLTKHRSKSFDSSIISNDHHNNELKNCPVSSTTMSNNDDECLESGSVPDSDLTESLATATEALTEILVKNSGAVVDTNGNESPLLKYHPNVSSSSTQTECPSSSSYHICCCKKWNCWKLSSSSSASLANNNKREQQRTMCGGDSSSLSVAATGMAVVVQCQSSNRCCHHHRRKKTSGVDVLRQDKIKRCEYNTVSTKYSKSWRELRKTTNNRRSSNMQICRIQQSCNNRSSKPPV